MTKPEPCHCSKPNADCRRSGQPMVGRLWELCSGTKCPLDPSGQPKIYKDGLTVSEYYRARWDGLLSGDGKCTEKQLGEMARVMRAALVQALQQNEALAQEVMSKGSVGLGDVVHDLLGSVGITPERVSEWLGRPCKCPERQEKLNKLGRWVGRLLKRKEKQNGIPR